MANKNYYDILGVSKDASDKDIKSKYRDLSKKYHPDRQNGKSDKEKQEAENKFKEINEAYSVLSDAEKRKNYDTFGSPDGNPMGGFGDMFSGFGDMFNFDFSDLFGGGGRSRGKSSQRSEQVHPGESYNINVGLSIEDIYNGIQNKQFEIEVNRRCSSCNGSGGSGTEKCPHCNGTGMKREVKQTAFGRMENMTYCWECNGTGQRVKDKCTKCHGSGFEKYIEKLTLNVPKFARNGQQVVFNGAGSDSKSPKGVRGDVMVTLVYQFDTNRYRIINNDVYEQVNIPYYDMIGGNDNATIKLPNGKQVSYKIPRGTQNGQQIVIRGEGLNGGNYIIIPIVSLPKNPNSSEIEHLNKLIEKLK